MGTFVLTSIQLLWRLMPVMGINLNICNMMGLLFLLFEDCFISFLLFLMILTWNCKWAASSKFYSACRNLLAIYKPLILVLIEPRIFGASANKVIKQLGFNFSIREDDVGFLGGIWVLWKDPNLTINIIFQHRQIIHTKITFNNISLFYLVVYGSPNSSWRI